LWSAAARFSRNNHKGGAVFGSALSTFIFQKIQKKESDTKDPEDDKNPFQALARRTISVAVGA
jgi:hypothetical protein